MSTQQSRYRIIPYANKEKPLSKPSNIPTDSNCRRTLDSQQQRRHERTRIPEGRSASAAGYRKSKAKQCRVPTSRTVDMYERAAGLLSNPRPALEIMYSHSSALVRRHAPHPRPQLAARRWRPPMLPATTRPHTHTTARAAFCGACACLIKR